MTLTSGQHVVIHTAHLQADTVRALVFGFLMGVCGLAWGWNLFRGEDIIPWMEERYWFFGMHLCGGRVAAAAPLADNYFLFRCGDGAEYKERVLLTEGWTKP